MDWKELIFGLSGGLALFLYGMILISNGFQKALGGKAAKLLERATNHPIKGLLTGTGITMIFQSSSLVVVTLIGLVGASLITLEQAIGVMLGAEIGTTITAQIVAFNLDTYALPIIAVGFIFTILGKNKYIKYVGQGILGFGILFLGMSLMKTGVKPLQYSAYFKGLIINFKSAPLMAVGASALFTGIIQSSSATTGIIIAMASQGLLDIHAAIPLILGANIGTTVTGALASLASTKTGKRLSLAQVIFNVLSVFIMLFFLSGFTNFVIGTSGSLPRQIANAHAIFNILGAAIGLIFIRKLADLTKKIIPGKDSQTQRGVKYLEKNILSPSLALLQTKKEILRMALCSQEMHKELSLLFKKYLNDHYSNILNKEEHLDDLYQAVNQYLTKIAEKPLGTDESEKLTSFVHIISDIERIGDHIVNLARLKRKIIKNKVEISNEGEKDLTLILKSSEKIVGEMIQFLKKEDTDMYHKIKESEDKIDELEKSIQKRHTERLKNGQCKPETDVPFVSIVRNLERIGDHANNIANGLLIKSSKEEQLID